LVEVRVEGARMRATKLAAAAQSLKCAANVSAPFSLAFLTDRTRIPHPEIVARVLPKGTAIILRDYDWAGRDGLARRLKTICSARGLYLLIGADIALAHSINADGFHRPSWCDARIAPGADLIKTVACHSKEDLKHVAKDNADLALLSPAFATPSHPGAPTLGPAAFKNMARASPVPVLALGGVDETNAEALIGPNTVGLAAIGAFLPE
jgi:thiamine-phosphate pyrophosphorylase